LKSSRTFLKQAFSVQYAFFDLITKPDCRIIMHAYSKQSHSLSRICFEMTCKFAMLHGSCPATVAGSETACTRTFRHRSCARFYVSSTKFCVISFCDHVVYRCNMMEELLADIIILKNGVLLSPFHIFSDIFTFLFVFCFFAK
jgi:hypothetical protein